MAISETTVEQEPKVVVVCAGLIDRRSMLKTAVLVASCCIQIQARWCHRELAVIHILVGGICQAGQHAGTHCGGLEIHSRRHCQAQVTPLHHHSV